MTPRVFGRIVLLLCLATILKFGWQHAAHSSNGCAAPSAVRNDSIALLSTLANATPYAEPAHLSIDAVAGTPANTGGAIHVAPGPAFAVDGWAEDDVAKGAPAGVVFLLDGTTALPEMADCTRRPDVARVTGVASLADAGFRARIETTGLAPGSSHSIDFLVIAADGRGYWRGKSARFAIDSAPRALSPDRGAHLMTIETIGAAFYNAKQPIAVPDDRDLRITGWAGATTGDDSRDTTVVAKLDGKAIGLAVYGAPRLDVAAFFHAPSLATSGFSARIPLDGVPRGVHRVTIETRRTGDGSPRGSSTVLVDVERPLTPAL